MITGVELGEGGDVDAVPVGPRLELEHLTVQLGGLELQLHPEVGRDGVVGIG